jgi:hypothetical protein
MAQELSIEINAISNPSSTQTAQFVPSPKTVMVNDLVFWRNNDTRASHQPMPVGGPRDAWVTKPIPPAVDSPLGGGAATSNTFSYGPSGTTKQGIPYTCALHSGEKGTLVVLNNITIVPNAGAPVGDPIAIFPDDPDTAPTFNVNEAFVFINNDSNAHWPAPSLQQQNAWMSQAIQPGAVSPPIAISQPTGPNLLSYICVLHNKGAAAEAGVLAVQQPEEE